MRKTVKGFAESVLVVLFILLLAAPTMFLYTTKLFNEPRFYSVSVNRSEGVKFASENNAKYSYLCISVYGIVLTDFYRTDCHFVVNVERTKEGFRYNNIDTIASELGLAPNISWWENHGWIGLLLIIPIASVFRSLLRKAGLEIKIEHDWFGHLFK